MEYLTVEEVARRLKVYPGTVKRWLREGKLGGFLISDRTGWRVSEEDLARFVEEQRQASQPGDEGKAAA